MTTTQAETAVRESSRSDLPTLIAISLMAYVVETMLHELVGHGLTCAALGGHPSELGAFYVECRYGSMGDLGVRLVALGGPLASLISGALCLWLARTAQQAHLRYLLWLMGTIGLLTATGYPLFSGISGLGDFGTSRDGALYQLSPEWLWRIGITVLGFAGYLLVVRLSLRAMDALIGSGPDRVARARRLSLASYLSGAAMSVLIGLLNPHGLFVVLASAAASSLGGTSALAWMMYWMRRGDRPDDPPLQLKRSGAWLVAGVAVTLVYALVLGPTVRM